MHFYLLFLIQYKKLNSEAPLYSCFMRLYNLDLLLASFSFAFNDVYVANSLGTYVKTCIHVFLDKMDKLHTLFWVWTSNINCVYVIVTKPGYICCKRGTNLYLQVLIHFLLLISRVMPIKQDISISENKLKHGIKEPFIWHIDEDGEYQFKAERKN